MASRRNFVLRKKEKFLARLLTEGKRYIDIMEVLYKYVRNDSIEYKRMLFVMDRYTRCKIQLREDMEELKDMFEEMGETTEEEEDFDEDDDMMDYEEDHVEAEDFLFDQHIHFFHDLFDRKIMLAKMESLILRVLNIDRTIANFQLSMHVKLEVLLTDYCDRVSTILKNDANFLNSFKGPGRPRLLESIRSQYGQLRKLLTRVTEKQSFFSDIVEQARLRGRTREEYVP